MSNNRVLISEGRFREIVGIAHEFKNRLPLTTPVDPFAYVPLATATAVTFQHASAAFEYDIFPCPNPSFTITKMDDKRSVIFYDRMPRPEINWRIAKELGHITLGHINAVNRNIMSRVDSDPERIRLDAETEIFAAALLVGAEHLAYSDPVALSETCAIPVCQAQAILRFFAEKPGLLFPEGCDIFFSMA